MPKKKPACKCDKFFRYFRARFKAPSFDDVLVMVNHSGIAPGQANLETRLTRKINIKKPILSAAMTTVTEAETAIALAREGGCGVLHRAGSPQEQGKMVDTVKHFFHVSISNPITVQETQTIEAVQKMRREKKYNFETFPVKDLNGKIVGIVTSKDFRLGKNKKYISEIMSRDLKYAPVGTTPRQAYDHMAKNGKNILLLFDKKKNFKGIYTLKDVERIIQEDENKCSLDSSGRLLVGAAIGVNLDDLKIRMPILSKAGVDVVFIDCAHGDTVNVERAIRYCKQNFRHIQVVGGNVVEGAGAKRLIKAGADGIKVGIGAGAICTTRIVAGCGRSQLMAIADVAFALRGSGVPICADGGIKNSGDMMKALAAGADTIMVGSLFAGTEEAPGETEMIQGKLVKSYYGMGSPAAMKLNADVGDRYGLGSKKLVAEGVEGYVNYKGKLADVLAEYLGGIQSGMGYTGAKDIKTLHKTARFENITAAGLKESQPHDLLFIKSSSNYSA